MTSSWKQFFTDVTALAAMCFFFGNGTAISLQAQENAPETPAEAIAPVESTAEETAPAEPVATPAPVVEVAGPDPNAKGADASAYMHNSTDERSTAIDIATLLDDEQQKFLDSNEVLPPESVSPGAVLVLSQGALQFAKPVLDTETLQANRGDILRFHIWIKAEGVTAKDNLWFGAPSLKFQLYDDNRNLILTADSAFKTRGTYPWHNYYVDVKLPKSFALSEAKAAESSTDPILELLGASSVIDTKQPGLFLTVSNFGGGKAWFGGLSYERVPEKAQRPTAAWLDDATATRAPNPQYDELPMLLFYGLDTKLPWRFLNGNQAFDEIRSVAGLKKYLAEARNDWFQMQKGVAMLPYLYTTAKALKLEEGFEEGWMEALRSELEAYQDSNSGFWVINGIPNLFVTEAIATHCFSPTTRKHIDRQLQATPWNATAKDSTLKYGAAIINALLTQRVGITPAWSAYAFQPKEIGGSVRETKTQLTATAAAIRLLAQAKDTLTEMEPEYNLAITAIQEAYLYAVAHYVIKDSYLWRDDSNMGAPAESPEGMLELVDAAMVLERRTNDMLPRPKVTCERKDTASGEKATVTWMGQESDLVAVRIYAAPAECKPNLLSEKYLIGIIERSSTLPKYQDPLLLAQRMAKAAKLRWNVTPEKMGADYLASKLANIAAYLGGAKRLTAGTAGEKPVTMNVSSPIAFGYDESDAENANIKLYAVGVSAIGEVTSCIPLDAVDEE